MTINLHVERLVLLRQEVLFRVVFAQLEIRAGGSLQRALQEFAESADGKNDLLDRRFFERRCRSRCPRRKLQGP
jgi:hypothetical protein